MFKKEEELFILLTHLNLRGPHLYFYLFLSSYRNLSSFSLSLSRCICEHHLFSGMVRTVPITRPLNMSDHYHIIAFSFSLSHEGFASKVVFRSRIGCLIMFPSVGAQRAE